MPRFKLFCLAFVSVLAIEAHAQDAMVRDLSVEQTSAAQVTVSRPSSLKVSIAADRVDATYAIGEQVRLSIITNEDAYVIVYSIGPSGQSVQLFPNQFQTDNRVLAGRPVEIAGGNTGAKITASGRPGTELIKVVASSKPLTVVAESRTTQSGAFRMIEGGAAALTRDLQVTANQPAQNEPKLVFFNSAIYTVASRLTPLPASGDANTIVIMPGQPAQPVTTLPVATASAPIAIAGAQPFPLLIAVDKQSYKPGEKVTLGLTTLTACNLTVFDVTPAGQVRTLFPNAAAPANAIGARQTVLISDGSAASTYVAANQAGLEQVVAVCSTDATPVGNATTTDKAALVRELGTAATRPAGTTSIAVANFTITP